MLTILMAMPGLRIVEQPQRLQTDGELFESRLRKRRFEMNLTPVSHFVEWCCSVELLSNEVLGRFEANKATDDRIFDDKDGTCRRFLTADNQVRPQAGVSSLQVRHPK